jgi:hypothetical protein
MSRDGAPVDELVVPEGVNWSGGYFDTRSGGISDGRGLSGDG